MEWFKVGNRWHALVDPSEPDSRGRCGIVMVGKVNCEEFELYPPEPCHTCKMEVAMGDVEDEPLADAQKRGYIPVPFEADGCL